jgi:hypothetical protein
VSVSQSLIQFFLDGRVYMGLVQNKTPLKPFYRCKKVLALTLNIQLQKKYYKNASFKVGDNDNNTNNDKKVSY